MPKAVVCRELGPPERLRLETFAARPLASGQVRVAVRAAGINFPDILMAAGEYQLKPELPFKGGTNARLTSIPPRVPAEALTIGAAVGAAKVSAIRAALKGRLINGLVTDEATATSILKA